MSVTSPAPREVWRELLDQDSEALITQSPTWLDCICHNGSFVDASRLYEFSGGQRVVIPLARRTLPTWVAEEGSWPFDWGIGGPVSPGGIVTAEEARLVFEDLARRPALRTYVRFRPRACPAWQEGASGGRFSTIDQTAYVLDLGEGFGHVWANRFHASVRRAVRKAERSDIKVEVDHSGRLLPTFYQLYERSIARWAEQQHEPLALSRWRARRANPPDKLATVADRFGGAFATWVAWVADQPAAAILVLRQGAQVKYWRGAMDKELASPVRANDLLHRLVIEDAIAAGCQYYHMGDAREGSSLARFKEGFGAVGYGCRGYRRERLPVSSTADHLRMGVKRLVGFRDA
ncbi:MAG: GNAT family N-acetyltransferase [Streptosporangiaceae bacterium]